MKKLFCRLSSSRSFAKLFSLAACVALGSFLAQQAVAQDFGWEPFPPSFWEGGWDASLKCKALDGTTTLDRMTDTVVQEGTVECTFTDPARTPPSCDPFCVNIPDDIPDQGTIYQETAICSLSIEFKNLSETCYSNNGQSTLTVTGTCPVGGVPVKVGTINCEGAGPGGANPTFCKYAGNNPLGNVTNLCQWTLGYGVKNDGNVVALSEDQCKQAFPEDQNSVPPLQVKEVFKFAQKYAAPECKGEFVNLGLQKERFCHSDTWDPLQAAFCDLARPTTIGKSSVQGFLIADTEYMPQTINAKCTPNNNGVITLRVLANPVETDQNQKPIAIEEIEQSTITVNERPIIPGSCTFDKFPNPNVMTCKVNRCVGGNSIVDETGTLQMDALMNGTPLVGDVETKKVVH